jgi:hypothetical protein
VSGRNPCSKRTGPPGRRGARLAARERPCACFEHGSPAARLRVATSFVARRLTWRLRGEHGLGRSADPAATRRTCAISPSGATTWGAAIERLPTSAAWSSFTRRRRRRPRLARDGTSVPSGVRAPPTGIGGAKRRRGRARRRSQAGRPRRSRSRVRQDTHLVANP